MNRTLWIILAVMLAAHLLADFILPWSMSFGPDVVVVYALLGVVVAQVNLIALWTVFAPGSIGWRLPWAGLMAGGMWCALTIGNRLTWPGYFYAGESVQLAAILAGGWLLAQLPLWCARLFFKYRFFAPQAKDDRTEQQYHLRHLLLGMGLLSVLLGIGRLVMPPGEWWAGDWSFQVAVLLGTAVVVNLLVILPAIGISALSARTPVIVCTALLLLYSLVISVLECAFLNSLLGPGGKWFAVYLFNVGQMLSVGITLAILRWQGFRWLTQQQWQQEVRLRVELAGEWKSPANKLASEVAVPDDKWP